MATKQPSDKSHFILPDLGEGVHEAELIKWRVSPGESVEEHQTLAEMETDKALVEVPSPWAGTIGELRGSAGDIILVGSILVTYQVAGGGAPQEACAMDTAEERAPDVSPEVAPDVSEEENAQEEDAGTVVGSVEETLSVPESFQRDREESPAERAGDKVRATPAVRRIARELNVDLDEIVGSGRGGRVTASDVEAHAAGAQTLAPQQDLVPAEATEEAPLATRVSVPQEGVIERVPFRGIRRKIAEALHHSVQTAVHFTVVDEADVTALQKRRKGLEEFIGRKLSLLPFVMTAVCKALEKHPSLNATVDDFVDEILLHGPINLGCAVDTEHGLMVPVIHDAQDKSPVQLAEDVARLASQCRDRSVDREELAGGTFTISNVGSHGGSFATPIINYPEVAILAIGRAKERVLVKDGAFYAGTVAPLSLSCDHRVVDGAEGARFLNTVVELLQDPEALLPTL